MYAQEDQVFAVPGTDFSVLYNITGGNLINIEPNLDANSIILEINAIDDGSVTVILPT